MTKTINCLSGAMAMSSALLLHGGLLQAQAITEDVCYQAPLRSLELTEGTLPADVAPHSPLWEDAWSKADQMAAMRPYAVLDGAGEAYVDFVSEPTQWAVRLLMLSEARLSACAPQGQQVTGRLMVPKSDLSGMVVVRFHVPDSAATPQAREAFQRAKKAHYAALLDRNIPGTAWFRHQRRQADKVLNEKSPSARPGMQDQEFDVGLLPPRRNWRTNDELSATYALFTGGRAMSENLQLDRILAVPSGAKDQPTIDVDSIPGISVQEMDWSALVKDLHPALDPLASMIPADQHAIFFPSFNAMASLADEAEAQGIPVLRLVEVRAENALTRQRYERQLGISLNALTRSLGPQMVASVAITGSDPYFRTGTDVALLFESKTPAALQTQLAAQLGAAVQANPQAKPVRGSLEELAYTGARSDDRSVCSYIATIGNAVVVTNSLPQLGRLASAQRGQTPAIASLPEYTFFRTRYAHGDAEETALVFLSDAAIRRWCGPHWRIATSRRLRDAAVMAELEATYMDELARGKASEGPIHTELPLSESGELRLTPRGVWSQTLNTLAFLTPLAEIPLTKVTSAEAEAYQRWRDTYQRNWRQYFDPIAVRLGVHKDHLSADLTVMPLIASSEYQPMIEASRGAALKPKAGDPHNAMWHAAIAINVHSPMFQQWGNFAAMMAPDLKVNPLDWLGQCVAVYADADPFWRELAQVPEDEREKFMEENGLARLPMALHAEVANSLKLAAFLTALRAFVQQSAPGMTVWESLTYNEQPYVKISPTEEAKAQQGLENMAVYYAPSVDGLVITPNEAVLKRALDRQAARRMAQAASQPAAPPAVGPWLGSSLGLKAGPDAIDMFNALTSRPVQNTLRLRAWGNIPILNEWRRRYPDQNPIDVHEKYWHARLVCPGGGTYAWNEQFQTMESTRYGSPANPQDGPAVLPILQQFTFGDFGVSFEDRGLRARTVLRRKP